MCVLMCALYSLYTRCTRSTRGCPMASTGLRMLSDSSSTSFSHTSASPGTSSCLAGWLKTVFQHFANFDPRWGGERNRPLESAKKIADAATADEKEHKDGPATKRRRVQETSLDFHHEEVATNGEDSRVSSGKLNKSMSNPLSSCVEEASHPSPSNSQPAANLKERLSESPKSGEQEKDLEKEDNKEKEKEEKIYLDAEAVSWQNLSFWSDKHLANCESSRVKAKIIGGLSIANKLVEVTLMCKTTHVSQVKL